MYSDWKRFFDPETLAYYMGHNVTARYSSRNFEGDIAGVDSDAITSEVKRGTSSFTLAPPVDLTLWLFVF